jgi:hypothetical protein
MSLHKHLFPVAPSRAAGVVIWTLLGLGVGFNIGLYAATALDSRIQDETSTLPEQAASPLRPSAPN